MKENEKFWPFPMPNTWDMGGKCRCTKDFAPRMRERFAHD